MNTKTCPIKFVIGEDVPPSPQSGLWTHFVSAFKRYASFGGRATRKEYWSFFLFIAIFNIIISSALNGVQEGIIESVLTDEVRAGNAQFITDVMNRNVTVFSFGFTCVFIALIKILVTILIAIPTLGVLSRRCHDVGQSSIVAVLAIAGSTLHGITFSFAVVIDSIPSNFVIMEWLGVAGISIAGLAGLWLLFTVLFRDSQRGTNKYGSSTKYPTGGSDAVAASE